MKTVYVRLECTVLKINGSLVHKIVDKFVMCKHMFTLPVVSLFEAPTLAMPQAHCTHSCLLSYGGSTKGEGWDRNSYCNG